MSVRWLPLWLAVALTACSAPPRPKPPVVMIVVDTLRADRLGCYGADQDTSPALDGLAEEGVRFERAYASAPWTLPSIASILTGLYPTAHGIRELPRNLPSEAVTLAEALKDDGYGTGAVVSNMLLAERRNFQQGFDRFVDAMKGRFHQDLTAEPVTREASELVREMVADGRPFFLFVHYFDPHYNYRRHPKYGFAPARAGRLTGREGFNQLIDFDPGLRENEVSLLRDLYDEEVRYTDEGIGELLDVLRELGIYDKTIIVVTSDHGEEFLTHGSLGHSKTLYDDVMRVPLIVRSPGPARPAVVREPVSLVSLTPTILDLVGVVPEAECQAPSLAATLKGQAAPRGSVFLEVDYRRDQAYQKALVEWPYKLVRDDRSGELELYDLSKDPDEQKNIALSRPEVVRELRTRLENEMVRLSTRALRPVEEPLTTDERQDLTELGYLEDDEGVEP